MVKRVKLSADHPSSYDNRKVSEAPRDQKINFRSFVVVEFSVNIDDSFIVSKFPFNNDFSTVSEFPLNVNDFFYYHRLLVNPYLITGNMRDSKNKLTYLKGNRKYTESFKAQALDYIINIANSRTGKQYFIIISTSC